MTNIPIDIKLPDDVVKRLQPPTCDLLTLPEPAKLNLCLPFGGKIQGIVDATKAIPDDCAVTFSILLQLPPLMASLGCFLKVLGLMKPLMDFFDGASSANLGKIASGAADLVPAVKEVVDCFAQIVLGIPMFVRDLILLIAKLLKCIAQTLKSIAELMGGLAISIATAEQAGNKELLKQLQCAQDNAKAQAKAATDSTDVIQLIMTLAAPLLGLMPGGAPTITIPTFGSAEDAFALEDTANTMLSVASSLETIANALPSC
jgi:hypothetical protein